jgi:hypothetical protein
MYLATVACDSSNPIFSSSPWMRGAPHRGLAKLILRIRSMTSRDAEGRPCGWRLFHLQYNRNPCRCQAITVSGLTITSADCQPLQRRESQTHKNRSAILRRGRMPRLDRWRTRSWWRRASISACSATRVRMLRRRTNNSEEMIVNMARGTYCESLFKLNRINENRVLGRDSRVHQS